MSTASSTPPAPPIDLLGTGLGGGGRFRTPEEYVAYLREFGVTRFPFVDQPEGPALDAASAQLGAALAHFVDTYRTLHDDGYTGALREVRALVAKAPAGQDAATTEREVARYAGALALMPVVEEPERPEAA